MTIKALDSLHAFQDSLDNDESLDLPGAYERVATIRRAVDLRANGLANLPFGLFPLGSEEELSGDEYDRVAEFIKPLLYQVSCSLTIYGAAYLGYYKGILGGAPSTLIRSMLPSSVQPQYNGKGELTHFIRYENNRLCNVSLKDMEWIWYYNPRYENYPGYSPLQTVLRAAGTQHNLNIFAEKFFQNGALMPTIFTFGDSPNGMPSTVTDKDMSSFLNRIKRLMVGLKNAWRVDVLRGNIQSHTVGAVPKDIASRELMDLTNKDIATAFGIPSALLWSETANYANAREDEHHFYDKTIVPEANIFIKPKLNAWLAKINLRLEFQPNLLESYQYAQLQQAMVISQLTQEKVLSVNECRELLGYKPVEGGDEVVSTTSNEDGDFERNNIPENIIDNNEIVSEDIKQWRKDYASLWDSYVSYNY